MAMMGPVDDSRGGPVCGGRCCERGWSHSNHLEHHRALTILTPLCRGLDFKGGGQHPCQMGTVQDPRAEGPVPASDPSNLGHT